jgi:hypothetical protein
MRYAGVARESHDRHSCARPIAIAMKQLLAPAALVLLLASCGSCIADDCHTYDDKKSCKNDKACKWNPKKSICDSATKGQFTVPPPAGPWEPKVERAPDPCTLLTGQGYCENDTADNCGWNRKKARCEAAKPSSTGKGQ